MKFYWVLMLNGHYSTCKNNFFFKFVQIAKEKIIISLLTLKLIKK